MDIGVRSKIPEARPQTDTSWRHLDLYVNRSVFYSPRVHPSDPLVTSSLALEDRTEMHLPGHERCTACGSGGFLIQDIPREYAEGMAVEARIKESYQGWLKMPHGGIGMAFILELARAKSRPGDHHLREYPFRASFRWGGTPLFLGETVRVSVELQDDKIKGGVWKIEDEKPLPYLNAELTDLKTVPENYSSWVHSFVDILGSDLKHHASRLPRYRECFVCGMEREQPGLQRTFYHLEKNGQRTIFSFHGLDPDDDEHFYWLRISDQEVHPGVLASVMDETLGWSGFLMSGQGGVTVKLEIDFLRPLSPAEKIICCGRCTRVRGVSPHRLFWYSEGVVIPLRGEDRTPLAIARGQWMAMPGLTEEMKSNLLPRSTVEKLFS